MKLEQLRARLRDPEERPRAASELALRGDVELRCPQCFRVTQFALPDDFTSTKQVRVKCEECGLWKHYGVDDLRPIGFWAHECARCGDARHIHGESSCLATLECECRGFVESWTHGR